MKNFNAFKKDAILDMSQVVGGAKKQTSATIMIDCEGNSRMTTGDVVKYDKDGNVKSIKILGFVN